MKADSPSVVHGPDESSPTSSRPPAPRRVPRRPPSSFVGFVLYLGHLVLLPSIALSNVVAGLAVLSSPWSARRRLPRGTGPFLVALGAYSLLLLFSIAASYQPALSADAASELFTLSLLVLALLVMRGEERCRWVVDGLMVVAALVAVTGLAQLLVGYGGLDQRIRGPFSHWMTFAHFLLVCDALLIARVSSEPRQRGWRRVVLWPALVAINFAVLLSLTRSAWVALAVTFTVTLALRAPRWLAAYVPLGLLLLLLAPVPLLHRIGSVLDVTDPSNYDRLCMARAGLAMVAERPLLGIGPEMVEERYPIYRPESAPRLWVPHLHNSMLQLAAERGLPSLAAYLAMTWLALVAGWRGFRAAGGFGSRDGPTPRSVRSALCLGSMLALIAFNLGGLFENNWSDTEVQRLALFAMALPFCCRPGDEE